MCSVLGMTHEQGDLFPMGRLSSSARTHHCRPSSLQACKPASFHVPSRGRVPALPGQVQGKSQDCSSSAPGLSPLGMRQRSILQRAPTLCTKTQYLLCACWQDRQIVPGRCVCTLLYFARMSRSTTACLLSAPPAPQVLAVHRLPGCY